MTGVSLKDVENFQCLSTKMYVVSQTHITFVNFIAKYRGSSCAEEFADTQILHSLAIC